MQRVHVVQPEQTEGRTRELFVEVEQAFGMVPNAAKLMGNSPAVLESFLGLSRSLAGVGIGEKLFHQVKLSASEANACSYCTSILSAVGPQLGLSDLDLIEARSAKAIDPRTDAALKFASAVLENRGKVSNEELAAVRAAGYDDAGIVEIVAGVVAGCFTNFLNNVAETELDVPACRPLAHA